MENQPESKPQLTQSAQPAPPSPNAKPVQFAQPATSSSQAQQPQSAPRTQQPQSAPQTQAAQQSQPARPASQSVAQSAAAAQPMQPVQKKSRAWIVGLAIVAAVMIVCIVTIVSCTSTFNNMTNSMGLSSKSEGYVKASQPSVAVIDITGTIQYDGSTCSPEGLSDMLEQADKDSNVKAVVLRVDSGGGTATAGEEMAGYVRDFKKPVVVSSASTNASAAYEISSQADYIFTAKTTAIGAIGVILQVTDLSGLYHMLGINVENITSVESKDASFGTRPLSDEERQWYQTMVDQINGVFLETVAQGRSMEYDQVKALANGLPYTGIQAVENGLADEIGTLEDAVKKASTLAGYEDLPTISLYQSQSSLFSMLDLLGQTDGSYDQNSNARKLKALVNELEQNAKQ